MQAEVVKNHSYWKQRRKGLFSAAVDHVYRSIFMATSVGIVTAAVLGLVIPFLGVMSIYMIVFLMVFLPFGKAIIRFCLNRIFE